MNPDFGEARFILAVAITVTSIVALFTRFIDQGHFVTIVSIVLGLYTAHSMVDDKIRDWKGLPHQDGHE
jgi:hypothetical protein